MSESFDQLRILGISTSQSHVVKHSICRIYLKLSAFPPLGWSYMLTKAWETLSYAGKPNIGIQGAGIWIECQPEELKTCHLPWVEKAIALANHEMSQSFEQRMAAQVKERAAASDIQARLDAVAESMEPKREPVQPRMVISTMLHALKSMLTGKRGSG
jgi:hypothetical protein